MTRNPKAVERRVRYHTANLAAWELLFRVAVARGFSTTVQNTMVGKIHATRAFLKEAEEALAKLRAEGL